MNNKHRKLFAIKQSKGLEWTKIRLAAGTLWGAYALPQTTLAAMGCLLLRGPVVSKYVSLLNRLAAIQQDRSIKRHSKTQPHKQSLKHKKHEKT